MEFCYLVCCSVLNDNNLEAINAAIADFHHEHVAFNEIYPDKYSLPHQHSIIHYQFLIQEFGAPNGLCLSITKSKHIKAIKEPWCCLSQFESLTEPQQHPELTGTFAAPTGTSSSRQQQLHPPPIRSLPFPSGANRVFTIFGSSVTAHTAII